MKFTHLMIGLAGFALVGCATTQQAMDRSMMQAEGSKTIATDAGLDSASTQAAAAHLDSANAYKTAKKQQEATNAASLSVLEYRLALINAEKDSLQKEDARLEEDLRNDVERKILYQNILDNEGKEGK